MLGHFENSKVVYLQPKIIYHQDASEPLHCEISKFKTDSTTPFRIDSLGAMDQSLGKNATQISVYWIPFYGNSNSGHIG
jgi:hypothetical protein